MESDHCRHRQYLRGNFHYLIPFRHDILLRYIAKEKRLVQEPEILFSNDNLGMP